jgi:CDP-diacylglycerol--glycerol-3-phosphate 3-phosphatidyltransferase
MNLPNKLTVSRILMTFVIIFILLFPFDAMGVTIPSIFVNETLVINIKYLIAGVLFLIASFTDFLDGYVARKYNLVTDLGKMLDAIADKILVNSVLIILAAQGFIHPLIPVVMVVRDSFVNSIKMVAGSKGHVVAAIKTGKYKTASLMVGIALTLFYNLPFELWNLKVSNFLLIVATVLAIISGFEYYNLYKELIFEKKEKKNEINKSNKIEKLEI